MWLIVCVCVIVLFVVLVLIYGEIGIGKELFVCVIYGQSVCSKGLFVMFNCGVVVCEIFVSELFGYVCGVFIGVDVGGCVGWFELVQGGILCFDEIGEFVLDLQLYFLCVFEEGVVMWMGESMLCKVDVCIVVMINCNLFDEVVVGCFWLDLYYWFSIVEIVVLLLCECLGDFDLLIDYFNVCVVKYYGRVLVCFMFEVMVVFCVYCWLGNVCELCNIIE